MRKSTCASRTKHWGIFSWPAVGSDFLNKTQKALIRKEKIDTVYYIKIKD